MLEDVSHWGQTPPKQTLFSPDECWALRRGHLHAVGSQSQINPRCQHLQDETDPCVCVPLLAQGKALGIIYLSQSESSESETLRKRQRHLAETTSESISLALANLTLRESLRSLSFHDSLTGLFNRRFMEETLERELIRVARLDKPLAIAMLDIDHFKKFNDTFGHDAGDVVLKEVACRMMRFRLGTDIACRYGGEEFILILPEIVSDQVLARLEQLRRSISEISLAFHGKTLPRITVSIGISFFPIHGTDASTLIKIADDALYLAKNEGRDRIVMFDGDSMQDLIKKEGG